MSFAERTSRIVLSVCAFGAALVFGASCSKDTSTKSSKSSHEFSHVALSAELKATSLYASCDQQEVSGILEKTYSPEVGASDEVWQSCQRLYACSPTTSEIVRGWFVTGASFHLGFTDLSHRTTPGGTERVKGLYVSGTENVYLDTGMTRLSEACPMLLHELVHRFDPQAQAGEESVRTEFKAYYYQTAFTGELERIEGPLGDVMRDRIAPSLGGLRGFHTRESLLKAVARLHGEDVDLSLAQNYRPFVWESARMSEPAAKFFR